MRLTLKVMFWTVLTAVGYFLWLQPEMQSWLAANLPFLSPRQTNLGALLFYGVMSGWWFLRPQDDKHAAVMAELKILRGNDQVMAASIADQIRGIAGVADIARNAASTMVGQSAAMRADLDALLPKLTAACGPEAMLVAVREHAEMIRTFDPAVAEKLPDVLRFITTLASAQVPTRGGVLEWDDDMYDRFSTAVAMVRSLHQDGNLPRGEQLSSLLDQVVMPLVHKVQEVDDHDTYVDLDDRKTAVESAIKVCFSWSENDWDDFKKQALEYVKRELEFDSWPLEPMSPDERDTLRDEIRDMIGEHFSIDDEDGSLDVADDIMRFLVKPHTAGVTEAA